MSESPMDMMFSAGTRYRWDDGTASVIDVQSVGVLRLPTGHLIAQDPGWGVHPEVQPFIVTVPPGHYPVTLSISHWERSPVPHIPSPMRLVNAAKLNVRAEPAVSWELAMQPGQDRETLEDGRRARNGEVVCFVADLELLQHSLGTALSGRAQ